MDLQLLFLLHELVSVGEEESMRILLLLLLRRRPEDDGSAPVLGTAVAGDAARDGPVLRLSWLRSVSRADLGGWSRHGGRRAG